VPRPRVLIEDWLPIEELGIESRRERAVVTTIPALNSLHVWWARRPLVASAGVILTSLLPPWTPALAAAFPDSPSLRTDTSYKRWILSLCGVLGDPIQAKKKLDFANANGIKLKGNAYGYPQAYRNRVAATDLQLLHEILVQHWGTLPSVIDPTAGGGSIPYEAVRLGLPTTANDLNQVAAAVLRAGVAVPAAEGTDLLDALSHWGHVLIDRVAKRLEPYFARPNPSEEILAYIHARTVACPRTGKPVPLSPNWWLRKEKGAEAAIRVVTRTSDGELDRALYEVVLGPDAVALDADVGSVARGAAISIWDGLPVTPAYIKAEAQAGRLGSELCALSTRVLGQRSFRGPAEIDLDGIAAAEECHAEHLTGWLRDGSVPDELRYLGPADRCANYGLLRHIDLFSPRQLVGHAYFVEEFRKLLPEIITALGEERGRSVAALLGLMQGKTLNWNSNLSSWNVGQQTLRSVFDRHDFSFKWSFAEFDACRSLFGWALDRLLDNYREVALLLTAAGPSGRSTSNPVRVVRGNAADLGGVEDESQTLVCMDPPYYDNVMYAELSDFFGVWEQHTVGVVWPDLMPGGLADVKNEAVANEARFADSGRRRKPLAEADYEAKMHAIFAECYRVLRSDGVLTVMFTHKKAEAWDTLGMGLMQAGFTVETSWPVATEKEQSLHQAKKNAAASTIMMVCRKRETTGAERPFFEDLEADVRRSAREAVDRFSAAGISGVDLLLSTYGPALSVISANWPVYSSEADASGHSRLLRPEEALDAAREEVVRLQRRALIGRPVDLDPITDFTLLAWATFQAIEFPFDDARRLALAVGGLDLDELVAAKVLTKKAGTVVLLEPKQRLCRKGDDKPGVRPEAEAFHGPVIDAVHTVLYVAEVDGLAAAKALIDRTGLANDGRFTACLQGLVHAIPRTKDLGNWVRPEAGLLDALVTAYFPDIEIPADWTGRLDLDGD
jgi:adenine-specific DNA methylase